jgi:hypothetical protein
MDGEGGEAYKEERERGTCFLVNSMTRCRKAVPHPLIIPLERAREQDDYPLSLPLAP